MHIQSDRYYDARIWNYKTRNRNYIIITFLQFYDKFDKIDKFR